MGLELVDVLTFEPSLENYHLLPSVRGDLLFKLGRFGEARLEFERAASTHAQPASARCCSIGPPRAQEAQRGPIHGDSNGASGPLQSVAIKPPHSPDRCPLRGLYMLVGENQLHFAICLARACC